MSKTRADAPQLSDFGTPELHRRQHTEARRSNPEDKESLNVYVEQDQIQWLLRRSYFDHQPIPGQTLADAGNRYRTDHYVAGLSHSCTGSFEPPVSGGVAEISDIRIAAQARRDNAIRCLDKISHDLTLLVDAVCIENKSCGRWVYNRFGSTPDEGIKMLIKALTALVHHYGFVRK